MPLEDNPLVSCVMPTFNRADYIQAAIDCWKKQTYQNRELIILDDGTDNTAELIPNGIRYEKCERVTTGRKRNMLNAMAAGPIICNFDSDDWCDPERIAKQVAILQRSGKSATGYANIHYWHVLRRQARLYKSQVRGYVCGGTLCYLKEWWERHKYPDKLRASDNDVIYPNLKDIEPSPELGMYVARAHDSNVGGDKRHIGSPARPEDLPAGFWENEKLRLSGGFNENK